MCLLGRNAPQAGTIYRRITEIAFIGDLQSLALEPQEAREIVIFFLL
jgi:hypothetical protein